jgi:hypothetical protein
MFEQTNRLDTLAHSGRESTSMQGKGVFRLAWGAALAVALMQGSVAQAATLRMPTNCASVSACMTSMASGDTLLIADGTYSGSVTGVKANTIIAAENDGKVIFTGTFSPGNAGFEMQGIIVKSSDQKELGAGNTYRRMSFIGGPSCGNTVNSLVGANTKIYNSAFYGKGGRYLVLAYQVNGVYLENVILRPDGGWGQSASCSEYEPHAAYNMYDSEGFSITGAVLVDAISDADGSSENIGGQVVNTHNTHAAVGTISQSVITTSGEYGRFASDGNGSHNVTITDSVAKGSSFSYGLTRHCGGTTTATRFDTDKSIGEFSGSINRTSGASIKLNFGFLNDTRWKREMCTDAGVTRGFCASTQNVGDYVATKIGVATSGPAPSAPSGVVVR